MLPDSQVMTKAHSRGTLRATKEDFMVTGSPGQQPLVPAAVPPQGAVAGTGGEGATTEEPVNGPAVRPRGEYLPQTTGARGVFLVALVLISLVFWSLWQPLLIACVLAATFMRVQDKLAAKLGDRRSLAAFIVTCVVVLLIVTPFAVLLFIGIEQAVQAVGSLRKTLEQGDTAKLLQPLPDWLEKLIRPLADRLPKQLSNMPKGAGDAGRWAAVQLQTVLIGLSAFLFDLAMMMIAFFALLTDGHHLVEWVRRVSPLGHARTHELLKEFRGLARVLVGSNFATGAAQAAVATVGYFIAHAPQPIFFGMLTLLTSFIPSVGTSIVALPLVGYLFLVGKTGWAIFLLLWAIVVVGLIDNVLRPYLIRSDMHAHGALVFFSIVGAMAITGVSGLMLGPLVLTLFLSLMRFRQRDLQRRSAGEQAPPPVPLPAARTVGSTAGAAE